jgi:MerR family mercuric resistance operon transcriptional regulator
MNQMTIGRAAKAAGVKIDTIRYYQRIGLITEPVLPQGGQRKYGEDVVRRVKFIKRAQTLGFTLDETSSLLSFEEAKNCCETKELAEHKIKEIDGRIADLRRIKKTLGDLTMRCENGDERSHCPIIDTLASA